MTVEVTVDKISYDNQILEHTVETKGFYYGGRKDVDGKS